MNATFQSNIQKGNSPSKIAKTINASRQEQTDKWKIETINLKKKEKKKRVLMTFFIETHKTFKLFLITLNMHIYFYGNKSTYEK